MRRAKGGSGRGGLMRGGGRGDGGGVCGAVRGLGGAERVGRGFVVWLRWQAGWMGLLADIGGTCYARNTLPSGKFAARPSLQCRWYRTIEMRASLNGHLTNDKLTK